MADSLKKHFDALTLEVERHKPSDVLQYAANFFNKQLESERSGHLSSSKGGATTNGKTTESSGPFTNASPFGGNTNVNSIKEEDEEHDSFDPNSQAKPPSSSFGRLTAAATGAAAGMFGASWLGGSATESNSGPQEAQQPMPPNYGPGRRVSVSAESMQPDVEGENWKPPKHAKTPDQLQRLKTAVASNFLFSGLDDDSFSTVLDALVEKNIPAANIKVISQGDEGDFFYVIEEGDFDVYIHPSGKVEAGPEGMGNKVTTIGPGGSFGELALMYNAARAATVVSSGKKGGTLWALDRITFRRILMDSAFQKRKFYESFLEEVPLLSNLKGYERSKIADSLESVKYSAGEKIITEGEPGDNFYLLEAGEAQAFKGNADKSVKDYKRGDYFGELALLDDKPRAASVVAKTDVKVAKLGRDGFKRLLGPVESLMRREDYDVAPDQDGSRLDRTKTVT